MVALSGTTSPTNYLVDVDGVKVGNISTSSAIGGGASIQASFGFAKAGSVLSCASTQCKVYGLLH